MLDQVLVKAQCSHPVFVVQELTVDLLFSQVSNTHCMKKTNTDNNYSCTTIHH